MTMTEPDLFLAPTWRAWLQAVARLFVTRVPTAQARRQRSAGQQAHFTDDTTHLTPAVTPPTLQSALGAQPQSVSTAAGIAPEDWDLLFRCALEFLARVATARATPDGGVLRLQATGNVLGECIAALDQLRMSAAPAHGQRMPEPVHSEPTDAASRDDAVQVHPPGCTCASSAPYRPSRPPGMRSFT